MPAALGRRWATPAVAAVWLLHAASAGPTMRPPAQQGPHQQGHRTAVGSERAGLIVSTLNGDLHGFDAIGNPLWRHSLGAPMIEVHAGEDDGEVGAALSSPRLLPALDGTLFFVGNGQAEYVRATMRQVVDSSPLKVAQMPDIYLLGERKSRVVTIELPDLAPMEKQPDADATSVATPGAQAEGEGLSMVSSAGGAVGWPWRRGPRADRLRFGTTKWSIAAMDDQSHAERWTVAYTELSGISSRPAHDRVADVWRDRVVIDGMSMTMRPPKSETECDEERDSGEEKRTFTFDSEVLTVFAFSEVAADEQLLGDVGLEVIARAPARPVLASSGPGQLALPRWFAPAFGEGGRMISDLFGVRHWHPALAGGPRYPTGDFWREFSLVRPRVEGFANILLAMQLPLEFREGWPNTTAKVCSAGASFSRASRGRSLLNGSSAVGMFIFGLGMASAFVSHRRRARATLSAASMQAPIQTSTMADAFTEPMVPATPGSSSSAASPLALNGGSGPLSGSSARVPPGTALHLSLHNGHFAATFTEEERIGEGGFGAVFRARHRLESGWYAVKFVPLHGGLEESEAVTARRDFTEVFNLVRLAGSRHVVRYHTCWCEEPQFLPPKVAESSIVAQPVAVARRAVVTTIVQQPLDCGDDVSMSGELSRRFACEDGDEESSNCESYHASTLNTGASSLICFVEDSQSGVVEGDMSDGTNRSHRFSGSFGTSSKAPRRPRGAGRNAECEISRGRNTKPANNNLKHLEVDPLAAAQAATTTSRGGERFQTVLVIQMELCTGSSLRCWLSSEQRSEIPLHFVIGRKGEALELAFAKQLMKGIREIHNADMVHRDVKPHNVFVTNEQVLKIGDFGLARHACDKLSSGGGDVGTPAYAAPEGGAQANAPADVFSAALVILELLCPPFCTAMEHAQVLEALRVRRELPEHIKQSLPEHAELLRRMAHEVPEQRPSAEEAYAELKRLGCTVPSLVAEVDAT